MEFTLFHQHGSRSQRVRWLLEELEVNYHLHTIDLFKGEGFSSEHLKRHPLGQLPVLDIEGQSMFESGAIVQWLADTYQEKGLAPALDSPLRREFNQWMYFSVTSLEAPAWEIILHSKILRKKEAIKDIIPFATKNLLQVLAILEKQIDGKKFILGDQFTAVDIMMAYILMWFPEHLQDYAQLKNYVEHLKQRPAYVRSVQN